MDALVRRLQQRPAVFLRQFLFVVEQGAVQIEGDQLDIGHGDTPSGFENGLPGNRQPMALGNPVQIISWQHTRRKYKMMPQAKRQCAGEYGVIPVSVQTVYWSNLFAA